MKTNCKKNAQIQPAHRMLGYFIALISFAGSCCNGSIFDTFIAYRHGTNAVNGDSSRFPYEAEPDVPDSVENVFAHLSSTKPPSRTADTIDVVHCYSMRNGLYGSPTEAHLLWSRIDFS